MVVSFLPPKMAPRAPAAPPRPVNTPKESPRGQQVELGPHHRSAQGAGNGHLLLAQAEQVPGSFAEEILAQQRL